MIAMGMIGPTEISRARLREVVQKYFGPGRPVRIHLRRLTGGIESPSVMQVSVHMKDLRGRIRPVVFVAKHLHTWFTREADVYRALSTTLPEFSRILIGVEPLANAERLLLLRLVRPARHWPWGDRAITAGVLEQLARLHREPGLVAAIARLPWDYEQEILASARATVESMERLAGRAEPLLRRALPAARRLVSRLEPLRRQLLAHPRFGQAVLHGDVHSGNVILTRSGPDERAVLLDWSRARVGSALEDVSSWTESLGIWEPEARRGHDTIIGAYLRAHGDGVALDHEVRAHYWLAASSNVLAGTLSYHLHALACSPPGDPGNARNHCAIRSAARVLRRADAYWR